MISFMKTWCEGIIVAIIISIIIETILPEGTNKKYVKVVIGIYIIFTILNPIIGNLNSDIDFSKILDFEETSAVAIDENSIKEVYIDGIKSVIKGDIENEGFEVLVLEIFYDSSYENIEKIILEIKENDNTVSTIEEVKIGISDSSSGNKIDNSKINYLKNLISSNYEIDEDKIFIN